MSLDPPASKSAQASAAGNLFADCPASGPSESFLPLLQSDTTCIERIVSNGHASPPGFWYDQPDDEWVMLAAGAA